MKNINTLKADGVRYDVEALTSTNKYIGERCNRYGKRYFILFCIGGRWEAWEEGCLGDIKMYPQILFFKAMKNTKKYITSATNVNDSIGENSISYLKN